MSSPVVGRFCRKTAAVSLFLAAVVAGLIPAGGALCLPLPDGHTHIHIGWVLPDGDEAPTMRVTTHPVRQMLQAASAGRANFGQRQPVILPVDAFALLLAALPVWAIPNAGLFFSERAEEAWMYWRAQRPEIPPPRPA